jgi:hypothetical protein
MWFIHPPLLAELSPDPRATYRYWAVRLQSNRRVFVRVTME